MPYSTMIESVFSKLCCLILTGGIMALYRTGQASMDAQGVITGYKTKWKDQLTLIRTGATIVFATSPVSFATISEIVSDTQMRATATGGKEIPKGDYVILIHDSLTVDGLAQDVAETLRYYQSKETEFERFIEVIENLDMDKLEGVFVKVKEQADRAEAGAAKSHQSSLTAQSAATVSAEEAEKAKSQVDLAKQEVVKASQEVSKAAQEVENAKAQVQLANNASDFASAQASNAAEAAGKSTVEADRAAAAAKKAQDLADQFDATKVVLKDKNLGDIPDKAAARRNLGVDNIESNDDETKLMTKGKDAWLSLRQTDRKWGFWDETTRSWCALGVEQGGTGAKDSAGARKNIGVDRVVQDANMTRIKSADPKTELRIGQDDWYVYRDSQDSEAGYVALGIQGGGTGANDAAGARRNLGALTTGDFGLGYKANRGIAALDGASGFFASGEPADLGGIGSGAGFQASYGGERRGQMAITLDGKAFYRFCNTTSNDGVNHPWKQLVAVGDYGIGAVNPPQIADEVNKPSGLYTALTDRNQLGSAWGIGGQAVGIVNLGMHHDRSNEFKSQIATSYGSDGRLFYRCSLNGTWKAWREVAVSGLPNFNMASGFNVSNTKGSQSYVVFRVENKGRPSTDNGAQVSIEIPHTAERPYLLQRRNDGTTTGQIVNSLPTLHGELLCRNNYVLNMANKNFNDLANTQFVSFLSGGTAHGTQNTPNVGYGNMLVIGSGGAGTGNYTTQLLFDKSTGVPFTRCRTDGSAAWTAWQKVTVAAVSDENLKNIRGNLNVEGALDNINRMEFKIFSFKDDETQRYRRGVISQQIKKIDKDYVNMVGDRMVLDQTPMMLDGLAAIKALRARDEDNKKRISALESEVAELKELVKSLICNKQTTLE